MLAILVILRYANKDSIGVILKLFLFLVTALSMFMTCAEAKVLKSPVVAHPFLQLDDRMYSVPPEYSLLSKEMQSLVATISPAAAKPLNADLLIYESVRAGLSPELVFSVVENLSHFDGYKVNPKGGVGFFQLKQTSIAKFGIVEYTRFHSRFNLRLGCTLLRGQLDTNGGHLDRAVLSFIRQNVSITSEEDLTAAILKTYSIRFPKSFELSFGKK